MIGAIFWTLGKASNDNFLYLSKFTRTGSMKTNRKFEIGNFYGPELNNLSYVERLCCCTVSLKSVSVSIKRL